MAAQDGAEIQARHLDLGRDCAKPGVAVAPGGIGGAPEALPQIFIKFDVSVLAIVNANDGAFDDVQHATIDFGAKTAATLGGEVRIGLDGDDAVALLEIGRRVLAFVQARSKTRSSVTSPLLVASTDD
jgi:hypothetical protein